MSRDTFRFWYAMDLLSVCYFQVVASQPCDNLYVRFVFIFGFSHLAFKRRRRRGRRRRGRGGGAVHHRQEEASLVGVRERPFAGEGEVQQGPECPGSAR